jgi:hypothetical protein
LPAFTEELAASSRLDHVNAAATQPRRYVDDPM